MSAKRGLEIFNRMSMTGNGLRRCLNQSVAGLTLLTVVAVAVPTPTQAQVRTTVPSTRTGANNVIANTAYLLGPSDRLKMDVFDVQEYSGEYVVLVDGTLNLPVIGGVPVQGLSLPQATELISSLYSRYVRRPLITLSLIAPRPLNIAVAGEVNRPGTYTIPPGGGGGGGAGAGAGGPASQFPTVTQVIALAGGITQSAEVGTVQIRRITGPTSSQVFSVDLRRLLGGDLTQDVIVRDGDSIVIPTVTVDNRGESRQLAQASFAPRDIRPVNVSVVGEVARPGTYVVTGGGVGTGGATASVTGATTGVAAGGGGEASLPTVTKAIQVAGGITTLADLRSITVRRVPRFGPPQTIAVNLFDLLRGGDLTQDLLLQEGDTIVIPTATALDPAEANLLGTASFAPNTVVVNVVGEVPKPGAIPLQPNTPLNQAVLAAGGFNSRAKRRSVDLIRLNANGTVSKREINVDLAQGIDERGNPILRNNDVVIVKRNGFAAVGDVLGNVLNPIGSFVNILSIFRILGGG